MIKRRNLVWIRSIKAVREFSVLGIVRELGPINVFFNIFIILFGVISIWLTIMMSLDVNNYMTLLFNSESDVIPGWKVIIGYVFMYVFTYMGMIFITFSIIFIFPFFLYVWIFHNSEIIQQFATEAKAFISRETSIDYFDVDRAIWLLLNGSGLLYISFFICVLSILIRRK